MSGVTYRLADELGGLPAEIVGEDTGPAHDWIRIRVADYELSCRRSDLVEVKPPSIDDPVTLPLELHFDHEARPASLWLKEDIGGWTLAQIYDHGAGQWSAAMRLNVGQLRRLARAAWQRADAVEGGAS